MLIAGAYVLFVLAMFERVSRPVDDEPSDRPHLRIKDLPRRVRKPKRGRYPQFSRKGRQS